MDCLRKGQKDQKTPGAQNPPQNQPDDVKISGNDEPGVNQETLPVAENDPDGLYSLAGVVGNVPDVVGQKNEGHQYPEGNGKVESFQGEDLALNRVGALEH